MKGLFDNLLLYEIVLLFLGVFLFLLLSFALVYYIIKKEEIKKLLLFFAIPIVMIAYPSIQQISISSDKFELSKYQEAYMENPDDSIAKQNLQDLTLKLEKRAATPKDILQISKSKLLLGMPKEAIVFANMAVVKENESSERPKDNSAAASTDNLSGSKPFIMNQASQLKELAQLQINMSVETDSAVLNDKLNNIEVNKNLIGTKAFVKRSALEKIKRTNN